MKIFVCFGSVKDENSATKLVVQKFISCLKRYKKGVIKVFYADLLKYQIDFCDGSLKPFITGETQVLDDMVILEREILSADLIVLASPVYANNVSGSIKTFLDRISHWTHLFRLLGKYGAVFSISSNSGSEYTLDYLSDIAEHLGLYVVSKSNFITNSQSDEVIDNIIDVQAMLAVNKIESEIFQFSDKQEDSFKRYQKLYKENKGCKNELDYWKKNGMLYENCLLELLNKQKIRKRKSI